MSKQVDAVGEGALSNKLDTGYAGSTIYVSATIWREMVDHCILERPYEACGLLSGRNGRVQTIWRMANVDKSPVSFSMDMEQLRRVLLRIHQRGEQLLGIYHSHPTAPPIPSAEDIAYAYYPEAAYIIVSLAQKQPTFGCYRVRGKDAIPCRVSLY